MEHAERTDQELVELAQHGSSPAFAVLVHRHAPAMRVVVGRDEDPTGAVVTSFLSAMRHLPERDPAVALRPWLLTLAAREVADPVTAGTADPPPLDDEELDRIWSELSVAWPRGRPPRRTPGWLGWAAAVVALACLSVLAPYVVLDLAAGRGGEAIDAPALVARPHEDELPRPVAPLDDGYGDLEPPPFVFPDVDLGPDPAPSPAPAAPEPAPSAPVAPDPAPAPTPPADTDPPGGEDAPSPPEEPTPDPAPDPAPEPVPPPEPGTGEAPESDGDA